MENTCNKDCHLWKKYKEKCPNYIRSGWKPENSTEIKYIEDCAPKRTMLMIQELYNRLIGVEKAQEEMRNEAAWVQVVAEVMGRNSGIDLQAFVEERQRRLRLSSMKEKLLIGDKHDENTTRKTE